MLSINNDIEDIEFCNRDVYESNANVMNMMFISAEIVKYTGKRSEGLLYEYINDHKHLKINNDLRNGINHCFAIKLSQFIKESPKTQWNITLWRGISTVLNVKVGDILDNLGFMWCSLSETNAKFYMNDTSKCYKEDHCDPCLLQKSKGTLFKINTPKGTNMLDVSYYDHMLQYVRSEIILNHNVRLHITHLENISNGICITCNL